MNIPNHNIPQAGFPCPRGCGTGMISYQEAQYGACRFCQGRDSGGIPGATHAGQITPTAASMTPGFQSHPSAPNPGTQYPPNVQLVKQRSPREMYEMTGDPRWLQAAEKAERQRSAPPQSPPPQAQALPPTNIELPAVIRDAYGVLQTLVEAVEKLNVIISAFSQAPTPPPISPQAHTAVMPTAAGQVALSPEMAQILANLQADAATQPTQPANVGQLHPSSAPAPTPNGKYRCVACAVTSLGVTDIDPKQLPHTCEKGAPNGANTQAPSVHTSPV